MMLPDNEILLPFQQGEAPVVQTIAVPSKLPNGTPYIAYLPIFIGYMEPDGFLPPEPAAHALFLYNLTARRLWEQEIDNPIHYEGTNEKYHGPDFMMLYKRIAQWYSCEPELMGRFWQEVSLQCEREGVPMVPNEERYRFNVIPEVRLQ